MNKLINLISILFMAHGIQNIIFFFYPIAVGDSIPQGFLLLSPELTGGFFSIACGYLIVRRSKIADLAVLLRCAGGIFSWGAVGTYFMLNPVQSPFIAALRTWPVILFLSMFVLIPVLYIDYLKLPRLIESPRSKFLIVCFILLMIANWLWSFEYARLALQKNPFN